MHDLARVERSRKVVAVIADALRPLLKVDDRGKRIALVVVAPRMCEHEVVAKVIRVHRPRDVVVDVAATIRQPLVAIETTVTVDLQQHVPNHLQVIPLGPEHERAEIRSLADHGSIVSPYEPKPCAAHQILDQGVESAKTEGDAEFQFDRILRDLVVCVEELDSPATELLKTAQRAVLFRTTPRTPPTSARQFLGWCLSAAREMLLLRASLIWLITEACSSLFCIRTLVLTPG